MTYKIYALHVGVQGSCHSQVRIYEGRTYITKRCKQTLACLNNEIQVTVLSGHGDAQMKC